MPFKESDSVAGSLECRAPVYHHALAETFEQLQNDQGDNGSDE